MKSINILLLYQITRLSKLSLSFGFTLCQWR